MSIIKAVDRAYRVMAERNWDTIYWAIDLHGVCLHSNYRSGEYGWINLDALKGLQAISRRPESKIILWSSVYPEEQVHIREFFRKHGVWVDGFNRNPHEGNTVVSDFRDKFYFSVLLDDKAGFDPETDWEKITDYLKGLK